MAQLTGNPIQSSYLGLLKTNNNAALPAAGLSNPIQDGAGNDSMINMSQTEIKIGTNHTTQYFTQYAASGGSTELKDVSIRMDDATASQYLQIDANYAGLGAGSNYIVSTPTGSSIVGPLDLSGATVSGLPAQTADIPNIANGSMQATIVGYPAATMWTACTFGVGRPNVSLTLPATTGSGAMALVPFNIDSNQTVTTFGIPMEVLANDTLYLAVYEQASNGGPGVRVLNLSKSITTADNNTWVEVTAGSWTPTQGKNYWIGAMTGLGAGVGGGLGYISGDQDVFQRFSTTNNSSVGSVIAANTLFYYGSSTPSSDLSAASFNFRDERAFYAWK